MTLLEFADEAAELLSELQHVLAGDAGTKSDEKKLQPVSRALLDRVLGLQRTPDRPAPREGQIWCVRPSDQKGIPALVLLTRVQQGPFRAILVLEQAWMAATDDVIIPGDKTSTGNALAACLWRDMAVAPSMLSDCVGSVSSSALRPVLMLLQHHLTGGFVREATGASGRASIPGSDRAPRRTLRWKISAPDGTTEDYLTGPRIIDEDDPRTEIRNALVAATEYIEADAGAELEAESVATEPVGVGQTETGSIPAEVRSAGDDAAAVRPRTKAKHRRNGRALAKVPTATWLPVAAPTLDSQGFLGTLWMLVVGHRVLFGACALVILTFAMPWRPTLASVLNCFAEVSLIFFALALVFVFAQGRLVLGGIDERRGNPQGAR